MGSMGLKSHNFHVSFVGQLYILSKWWLFLKYTAGGCTLQIKVGSNSKIFWNFSFIIFFVENLFVHGLSETEI